MADWITNDSVVAKALRAIDRAYDRAAAKAANWPLKEKVAAISRAAEERRVAYDRVLTRARNDKTADKIDGYDRDDLGESPDF